MTKTLILILAISFFAFPSNASAADIRIVPTGSSIDLVVIQGEIDRGDADRFLEIIKLMDVGAVLLQSPGGHLIDGILIGRSIRTAGLTTGVAPLTACASACALAWLGGTTRYMSPTALVGFHAAFEEKNGIVTESGVGNALVGAYLNELGLSYDAVVFVSSAAPSEMNWLNAAQAQQVGIEMVLLEADGSEVTIGEELELKLPSGFRWIVLESGRSPTLLRTARIADQIVRTQNGYYASVIGPYEKSMAEKLKLSEANIPKDSYLSSGNGFLFTLSKW